MPVLHLIPNTIPGLCRKFGERSPAMFSINFLGRMPPPFVGDGLVMLQRFLDCWEMGRSVPAASSVGAARRSSILILPKHSANMPQQVGVVIVEYESGRSGANCSREHPGQSGYGHIAAEHLCRCKIGCQRLRARHHDHFAVGFVLEDTSKRDSSRTSLFYDKLMNDDR